MKEERDGKVIEIGDFELRQPETTKALIGRMIREYEAQSEGMGEALKLYREVFAAQKRYLKKLAVAMPRLEDETIRERMMVGAPLIDAEVMEIDYVPFNDLFRELKGIVARKGRAAGARESRFLKETELSLAEVEELGKAWLAGREGLLEKKAQELDIEYSLLSLLLHSTFAAVFRKLALELHPRVELDQYPHAGCPICGALPLMGFNRYRDGLRVLECSLCGSRWGTPRMLCIFCGSPDQRKLRYLFVNGDQARRIHVCESCRTYIKIVNRRKQTDEIILPLEDIFTAYLDEVAEREGYLRGCRTVFS